MLIDLCSHDFKDEVGIILCGNTEVFYTNQTGGVACHHPQAEGVLVFFRPEPLSSFWHVLRNGGLHGSLSCGVTADVLDALEMGIPGFMPVRMGEQEEAWVFGSVFDTPCIVTWGNCD